MLTVPIKRTGPQKKRKTKVISRAKNPPEVEQGAKNSKMQENTVKKEIRFLIKSRLKSNLEKHGEKNLKGENKKQVYEVTEMTKVSSLRPCDFTVRSK